MTQPADRLLQEREVLDRHHEALEILLRRLNGAPLKAYLWLWRRASFAEGYVTFRWEDLMHGCGATDVRTAKGWVCGGKSPGLRECGLVDEITDEASVRLYLRAPDALRDDEARKRVVSAKRTPQKTLAFRADLRVVDASGKITEFSPGKITEFSPDRPAPENPANSAAGKITEFSPPYNDNDNVTFSPLRGENVNDNDNVKPGKITEFSPGTFAPEEVEQLVREIIGACRFAKLDQPEQNALGNVYRIAAAVHAGRLSRREVFEAAAICRDKGKPSAPAFFYGIVAKAHGGRDRLNAMLPRVEPLPKSLPPATTPEPTPASPPASTLQPAGAPAEDAPQGVAWQRETVAWLESLEPEQRRRHGREAIQSVVRDGRGKEYLRRLEEPPANWPPSLLLHIHHARAPPAETE